MLADCMFSQPYQSLIETQNGCLDKSNPNSIIGSTVNWFEAPVRADICTRRFSLSFISVVSFSMNFFYFSCIVFYLSCDLAKITSEPTAYDIIEERNYPVDT